MGNIKKVKTKTTEQSPMENLKNTYYEIAKLAHPDLTTDNNEKNFRNLLMTRINQAYDNNDINELIKILINFEQVYPNKIDFSKSIIKLKLLKENSYKEDEKDKNNDKIVSKKGLISIEENLIYPYVYYPDMYGYFLGFAKTASSPVYLCDCTINPIKNLIRLCEILKTKYHKYGCPNYEKKFPELIGNEFKKNKNSQPKFKPLLCHRCQYNFQKMNIGIANESNKIQARKKLSYEPKLRYSHSMYGTIFTQRYGWYVEQTFLRFGIYPPVGDNVAMMLYGIEFLPDICPINYQKDIIDTLNGKKVREFTREIENITRDEFDFKKLNKR